MDMRNRIATALLAAVVLAGCAEGLGGGSYTRDEVRREQNVRMGVVESVRQVQIEGTRTIVGPAAGAVVGGIAGSTVGGGRGSDVAAVLGAVVGGVAGQAIEQGSTRRTGVEVPLSRRRMKPLKPVTVSVSFLTAGLPASPTDLRQGRVTGSAVTDF